MSDKLSIANIKCEIQKLKKENISLNIDSIFLEKNNSLEKFFISNEELHELRSCSKLLVAMAVGVAIEKEMFSLKTMIWPNIKNAVKISNINNIEKIKKWTIRDLLLHQTGYESQMMSERFIENIDKEHLLEYVLNYNIPYEVGTRFAYNNVEPFIISVFFKEKFDIDINEFIKENIFDKLDIIEFKWEKYGKYCPGATGLYLKHSDFHKIGQLLINDGRYNGNQIISEKWINEMEKLQLKTPSAYKKERVFPKVGIGYYTFISKNGFIFRDGSNGQYIIINKKEKILITIMSTEREMKNITEILRYLI